MHIVASMTSWLGLGVAAEEESDDVPRWNGVPRGRATLIQCGWILASIVIFLVLDSRMPLDDGFGGYVPLIMSVMFLALGVTFTERLLLKSRVEGEVHHPTSSSH